MTGKDEEHHRIINTCLFCEEKVDSDKIRDHCHSTGKIRGPAHQRCNMNRKQKRSKFNPFEFQNFSNYVCHLFFRNLVD